MQNSERILVTVLAMLVGLVVSAGSAAADEYGRTNNVVDEAKVALVIKIPHIFPHPTEDRGYRERKARVETLDERPCSCLAGRRR